MDHPCIEGYGHIYIDNNHFFLSGIRGQQSHLVQYPRPPSELRPGLMHDAKGIKQTSKLFVLFGHQQQALISEK
ncbi:hypothetical protein NQ318_012833 [Aromia moschata]|uniref:Uncharacterized protein n=1 Tax=Aromia moschata TaxID=1265417 RepID=A0AAV8X2N3_9CUCU|nr:hypothetical protein NQ318_012833 [Aromia moschata]